MKKIVSLLFVSMTVLAIVGCSNSDSSGEPAPPVDKAKDAATQKTGAAPSKTQD